MNHQEVQKIGEILGGAKHIVIVQADNPDADSLASALALEQILGEIDKQISLYCGVGMPSYLRYLPGWDRVSAELPSQFDASIIVDASTMTLLAKLAESGKQGWLASHPTVVLDHHAETDGKIPFASVILNDPSKSSTGELVYALAKHSGWPLDRTAGEFIMTAILGDTQGLGNDLASAQTYHVMAELVELGVSRPKLEELRRVLNKMPQTIFRYKAKLIERTEFYSDDKIAFVDIPYQEIVEYSPLYNPNPLVQGDHLQTENVLVSIAVKKYHDGKLTASIRTSTSAPVAAKLAEHFGGGGHEHSAGFKIENGRPFNEVKSECIKYTTELLNQLNQESENETIQHTDS